MTYLCAPRYAGYQGYSGNPSASRSSGTGPLAVFFDATLVVSSRLLYSFHQILYMWNFGDGSAGTWTYGARTGVSKNTAYGPVAAHVYETPGTFSPVLTVFDGLAFKTYVLADIVVADPDVTFSGHNTICVSASTDFSDAPAGCLQVPNETDFDNPGGTALVTYLNAGKRVLYCGGETFTASATSTYTNSTGPAHVGSYGTGQAKVQWTGTAATSGFLRLGGTGTDFRCVNLEFDGQDVAGQGCISFQNTAWINFLMLNNYIHNMGLGFGPDWAASGGFGFYMVGNREEALAPSNTTDGVLPGSGSYVAILGNNFDNNGVGQQGIRLNFITRYVVSNNSVAGVISPKSSIDFRSSNTIISQYGVCSSNKVTQGASSFGINPSSANTNLGIFDLIIEDNYVISVAGGAGTCGIGINAERITVRNNIVDASDAGMTSAIALRGTNLNLSLPSKDVWTYNNTIYAARATGSLIGVSADADVSTGNVVVNNLVYTNGFTGTAVNFHGATVTASKNTGDVGTVTTDPLFTDATPATVAEFKVTAGSYALAAGLIVPRYNDALAVQISYGNTEPEYDMGAVQTTVN